MYFWESVEIPTREQDPEEHTHLSRNLAAIQKGPLRFLIQRLRQSLVHVTGAAGLHGIRKSGAVVANDGTRPFTYGSSRQCYATVKVAVALFDFERATDEEMVSTFDRYEQFFTLDRPATFVLHVDRQGLDLIHYDEATAEVGGRPMKIPWVEAWVPRQIPISRVRKITVVRMDPFAFRTLRANDPRIDLAADQIVAEVWPHLPAPRTREEVDAPHQWSLPEESHAAIREAYKRARARHK